MRIEHIAIWVIDLELMKEFYVKYFNAVSNNKYENRNKGFESCFLNFKTGCRLELMKRIDVNKKNEQSGEYLGLAHFALSVGSKKKVDELTDRLTAGGFSIIGNPRHTGDGYYESIVLDPEGNKIEITI